MTASHAIKTLTGLVAVFFILLAVVGAWRAHTPVPFWDMWESYIGFYERLKDGDPSVWFAQHNEHRIFLSRLLFWTDLEAFGGRGAFLIAVNLGLALFGAAVFREFIRDEVGERGGPLAPALSLVCLALLFSWVQSENLAAAFQSQFFLAQSLPLLAFLLLHRAEQRAGENRPSAGLFALACLAGAAAAGAMANGVLALPLMAAQAALVGARRYRIALLAGLAGLVLFAYFRDYRVVAGHGSVLDSLLHHPLAVFRYVLLYLASPFIRAFEGRGMNVSALLPLALIAGSAWFLWRELVKPLRSTSRIALLGFIVYIGGAALATAGGRVIFGVEQATASRYTTPALMAWIAFGVLLAGSLAPWAKNRPRLASALLLIIPAAFAPFQLHALDASDGRNFERYLGALAIEMGVDDAAVVGTVYPFDNSVLADFARTAAARDLSVFGLPMLRDAGLDLGEPARRRGAATCIGVVDAIVRLNPDTDFARLDGWIIAPELDNSIDVLRIIAEDGEIAGFAVYGAVRPDVANAMGVRKTRTGFSGYVRADRLGGRISVGKRKGGCEADMTASLTAALGAEAAIAGLLSANAMTPPMVMRASEGVFAHAPASLTLPVGGASAINLGFGMRDGSWEGVRPTDGVCFSVLSTADGRTLWERCLDPKTAEHDRGAQTAIVELPAGTEAVRLATACGETCDSDWSFWSRADPARNR